VNKLLAEILLKSGLGHGTSAAGGALILDGLKNDSPEQIATGIGTLLASAGLSAFRKWRRKRADKKAREVGKP
jgi:hypothetical protein